MSVELRINGNPLEGSKNGIEKGNLEICARVTAQTKVLAPVAQDFGGTLRNSYMYKVGSKSATIEGGFNDSGGEIATEKLEGNPEKNEGYVGSNVDYSVYQEFGTRKMAPQPHLRPSVAIVVKGQSAAQVLAKIQKEEMNGALRKGKKRVRF